MVSNKYEIMSVCFFSFNFDVCECMQQTSDMYLHTSKIRSLINFELTVNFLISSTIEYTTQVKWKKSNKMNDRSETFCEWKEETENKI